eukprot:CAMPEP_0115853096 /NCGR_PEP_ID=MMETSP0287-20121206/13330_1 /TAXON_ID=412157 /ORGANISM="Chrysochromulina rotalis, Strain UIO044" /LENGTH=93 /DNA_ID=CAMNT_0003307167 /DNA_START=187 /DNA_END=469 /DNA_ORIENTATION=+
MDGLMCRGTHSMAMFEATLRDPHRVNAVRVGPKHRLEGIDALWQGRARTWQAQTSVCMYREKAVCGGAQSKVNAHDLSERMAKPRMSDRCTHA